MKISRRAATKALLMGTAGGLALPTRACAAESVANSAAIAAKQRLATRQIDVAEIQSRLTARGVAISI